MREGPGSLSARAATALARATENVPECSIATAASEKCKTKPVEHSGTSRPAAPANVEADAEQPHHENCKTKPVEDSGTSASLSYRQLAAARFLARGRGSVEIGQRLGVARHTVARWKRNPAFIAEVERLRERLTRAAVAPLPHECQQRLTREMNAKMPR